MITQAAALHDAEQAAAAAADTEMMGGVRNDAHAYALHNSDFNMGRFGSSEGVGVGGLNGQRWDERRVRRNSGVLRGMTEAEGEESSRERQEEKEEALVAPVTSVMEVRVYDFVFI